MTAPGPLAVDGEAIGARALAREVASLARELGAAGAGPGALVAVPARNGPALVAGVLAAHGLGAGVVFPGRREPVEAALPVRARVHQHGAAAVVERVHGGPADALPDDVAAVLWTSGSTGDPNGVLLTFAGLAYQASATAERLELDASDGLLVPLPVAHAYGFGLLRIWRTFGTALYLESRVRPDALVARLREHGVTTLDGVPSLYALLAARARRDEGLRSALGRLRVRSCGGDLLPARLFEAFLGAVGAPLHDGYGLTEAGPNVALNAPRDWRAGTVGRPLRGTEVRVDARTGELLVRSPSVMRGYALDAAATEACLTPDGWLRTGDLGFLDADGYVVVAGRTKEALVVHGETFAPALVEDVLRECAGVTDACVVGLGSGEPRGDDVVALVEGSPSLDLAALRAACRKSLPPRARPRVVHRTDALPRLATGKLDRRAVRRSARLLLRPPRVPVPS